MCNESITGVFTASLVILFLAVSCMGPGDDVACPVCDNATELLVGAKCVPIEQVDECGPDGHSHGAECHCFSGQEPTAIDGKSYCLQAGCPGPGQGDTPDAEEDCEHEHHDDQEPHDHQAG